MTHVANSSGAAAADVGLASGKLRTLVERALAEDVGQGDVTTQLTVPEGASARGTFYAQQMLVVCGLPVAEEVFRTLEADCRWEPLAQEGAKVAAGSPLAHVHAKAHTLLAAERVSLNFIQHLSGIATLVRAYVEKLAGLKTELLDTRKTTPGLRALEKYAVRVGGGRNHRMRLDGAILIKNNHLIFSGGVSAAVSRAKKSRGRAVEVEVRNLRELEEALAASADAVLLDNMTPDRVRECIRLVRGRAHVEVSGGVTLETVRAYADAGADAISVGALTHSAPAAPINFLVEPR
jgi:nicotinate-nucleotide pyrophosphorylase (carboxylating)